MLPSTLVKNEHVVVCKTRLGISHRSSHQTLQGRHLRHPRLLEIESERHRPLTHLF